MRLVEREQFKGVVDKYPGVWKQENPHALDWVIVGKKNSEEKVGERDSFLHTRRDADCEARLQLGVETDCLVGNSQEGAHEVTKACFTLRPGCYIR